MKNVFNTPNKNHLNNFSKSKNFGLNPSNNPSSLNFINNYDKNNINNQNKIQNKSGNHSTSHLDLLPKSDFKRGFIKTQEDYHYYLLNEIQANSYSKSFSAVKYIRNKDLPNEDINFELSNESFLIKFYPKSLLSEFFTESEILDFEYSLGSKYKNLGLNDKHIQKIFEIIIANDCVLVVTELYENTLSDYLIINKDICKTSFLTSQLEIRIEWYFGKLIYEIINKLDELKKKNVFFGALINSRDIYIRNFNLNFTDILQLYESNMNVIEDIDFVLTNPFFYEIETLFKILDNGPISFTYPPEFLRHFNQDNDNYGLIQKDKGVYIFRGKEEKDYYEDNQHNVTERKNLCNLGTHKRENNIGEFNSPIMNNLNHNNINKNENKIIKFKQDNSPITKINSEKKERQTERILSSLPRNGKEEILKEQNQLEDEVQLLVTNDQRVKFDAWMIGMLVYEIIFNKYPENLTKLKTFNKVLEFYFPNSFANDLDNNFKLNKKQIKDTTIKLGLNLLKTGIQKNVTDKDGNLSISPEKQKIFEKKAVKTNQKMFTFLKSGISNVMKDLLSYCFKIDLKSRVYPSFDDCSDDNTKRLKDNFNVKESENSLNDQNISSLPSNITEVYDVHETLEILKGEGKNQYIDFIIRKNEYVKLILGRKSEYLDTFLSKFFYNEYKINYDKIEENKKKLDKILL